MRYDDWRRKLMAKYICLEGTDGVGKGTQLELLVSYLVNKGYKVLQTSEPGTVHLPETMVLREKGLSKAQGENLTASEREDIWQEIRKIHLTKLVNPALEKYDYIIQDRGILSGFSYAMAQGLSFDDILKRSESTLSNSNCKKGTFELYDNVILFTGSDVAKYLQAAKDAKQEYESGDVLEAKGSDFMRQVQDNFVKVSPKFSGLNIVNIENESGERKNPQEILKEVLTYLGV